jgi:small ubiquitin-related modifier
VPSKLTSNAFARRNIQDNQEVSFKIKKSTKLQKVYILYAQRKNVEVDSLRFLMDGKRVLGHLTAKMAELVDDDELLCVLAQVCVRMAVMCDSIVLDDARSCHASVDCEVIY